MIEVKRGSDDASEKSNHEANEKGASSKLSRRPSKQRKGSHDSIPLKSFQNSESNLKVDDDNPSIYTQSSYTSFHTKSRMNEDSRMDSNFTSRKQSYSSASGSQSCHSQSNRHEDASTKIDWQSEYEDLLKDFDDITAEKIHYAAELLRLQEEYENFQERSKEKDSMVNQVTIFLQEGLNKAWNTVRQIDENAKDEENMLDNLSDMNLMQNVSNLLEGIDNLCKYAKRYHDSTKSINGNFDRLMEQLRQDLNKCWEIEKAVPNYSETSGRLKRRLEDLIRLTISYGLYLTPTDCHDYLGLMRGHIHDITGEKLEALNGQLKLKEMSIATMEKNINNLKDELQRSLLSNKELQTKLEETTNELAVERGMNAELRLSNQKLFDSMNQSTSTNQGAVGATMTPRSSYRMPGSFSTPASISNKDTAALQKKYEDVLNSLNESQSSYVKLQDVLDKLSQDNEGLRISIDIEKTSQQQYKNKYDDLMKEHQDLQKKLSELYKDSVEMDKSKSSEREQNNVYHIGHDDKSELFNELVQVMNHEPALESAESANYMSKYEAKVNENYLLQSQISSLQEKLDTCQTEMTNLLETNENLTQELSQLNDKIIADGEVYEKARETQDKEVTERILKLRNELDHEKKRNETLNELVSKKTQSEQILEIQSKAFDEQIRELKIREEILQQNLSSALLLAGDRSNKMIDLELMQQKMPFLRDSNDSNRTSKSTKYATVTQSVQDEVILKLSQQLDIAIKRSEEFKLENNELSKSIEAYRGHISDRETEIVRLQQNMKDMASYHQQKNQEYINKISRLEELLHDMHHELQSSHSCIQSYMQEINNYKKQIHILETNNNNNIYIDKFKLDIKNLEDRIRTFAHKEKEMNDDLISMNHEKEMYVQRNQILNECIDDMKKDISRLKNDIQSKMSENDELLNRNESMYHDHRSLQQLYAKANHELSLLQGEFVVYCQISHKHRTRDYIVDNLNSEASNEWQGQGRGSVMLTLSDRQKVSMTSQQRHDPFNSNSSHYSQIDSKTNLSVEYPYLSVSHLQIKVDKESYPMDGIFEPDASINQIFTKLEPMLSTALSGEKVSLISYGSHEASSKVNAVTGNGEEWGLLVRSLRYFYQKFEIVSPSNDRNPLKDADNRRMTGKSLSIALSITQIENDSDIVDLLNDKPRTMNIPNGASGNPEEVLGGDESKNMANWESFVSCESFEDGLGLIDRALQLRESRANQLKKYIETTHLVAIIQTDVLDLSGNIKCEGRIAFIDLASSDRARASEINAKYFRCRQNNHRSLCAMRDVLSAIAKAKPVEKTFGLKRRKERLQTHYIPYTSSKLTYSLQEYLQPNLCKIILLVHISPANEQKQETLNSLSFVEKIKEGSTISTEK